MSAPSPVSQVLSGSLSRRGLLRAGGALGLGAVLVACGGGGSGSTGSGKGSIRALFMKQAGYSEDNIHEMVASFEKANPDIKVTADFVSYEALHDKIVAAAPAGTYDVVLIDVIWPAEFGAKNIVADVTDRWPSSMAATRCSAERLPRRCTTTSSTGSPGSWTPSTCSTTPRI